jgi:hypothetical protein
MLFSPFIFFCGIRYKEWILSKDFSLGSITFGFELLRFFYSYLSFFFTVVTLKLNLINNLRQLPLTKKYYLLIYTIGLMASSPGLNAIRGSLYQFVLVLWVLSKHLSTETEFWRTLELQLRTQLCDEVI